jgi:hypothetical protein
MIARWSEVYERFCHDFHNLLLFWFLSAFKRRLELLDCNDLKITHVDFKVNLPKLWVVKVLDDEVD